MKKFSLALAVLALIATVAHAGGYGQAARQARQFAPDACYVAPVQQVPQYVPQVQQSPVQYAPQAQIGYAQQQFAAPVYAPRAVLRQQVYRAPRAVALSGVYGGFAPAPLFAPPAPFFRPRLGLGFGRGLGLGFGRGLFRPRLGFGF